MCYFAIKTVGVVSIAVSERGVKESFSRVKKDINSLKRSINREILLEEELTKSIGQFTTKEEFYAFVRNLKDKLDSVEAGFGENVEQSEKALRGETRALGKELERIDNLRDELLESRKLKDSFGRLQATALSKSEFSGELKKLHQELNEARKEISKASKYERYREDISELRKSLAALERQQASLKELQGDQKKLAEASKNAEEELAILREDIENLSKASISKDMFREEIDSLKKSLSGIEDSFSLCTPAKEASKKIDALAGEVSRLKKAFDELKRSEIDAGELVTKKELSALKVPKEYSRIEKRLGEIEQRISKRDYESAINEIRSMDAEAAKKNEARFVELERDFYSAMDAGDESVSKVSSEVKELSKKIENEIDEVRKDIVEAAKDLVKDLDKKYSQKIQSEITKAALAPEKDLVAEIEDLRKAVGKGGGKAAEKQKEEFLKKLDELEEALSSEIDDLNKKLGKAEERAIEKAKAEFSKKLNLLEQTFLSEIENMQLKKPDKTAEKMRSEIMKKIDGMEERLYAEMEEASARKVKELESRFTTVDAFSGDLEKRFGKIEEKLERKEPDVGKLVKQSQDALLAEAAEMIQESEEKHASRFRQIEEKTSGRIMELEARLKDANKKILEYGKLREEIRKSLDMGELKGAREKAMREIREVMAASIRETERLDREIQKLKDKTPQKQAADIRKEVEYLLNNAVTNPDLDSQISSVEEKIGELKKELKSLASSQQHSEELARRLASIEKKVGEKKESKRPERREKKEPGIFSKALTGIANFFREEPEEPKIEVREVKEVKEKKEEKKEEKREAEAEKGIEEKPNTLKYILVGLIALLAIGGAAYFLLQPPEVTMTPDEACILNYECKIKEPSQYWFGCAYNETVASCRCYVGPYERCDASAAAAAEQKRESGRRLPGTVYALLDYKFYILGIVIIMGLIIYLMTRSPKEKEIEYEEEPFNLDEFLGKKKEK